MSSRTLRILANASKQKLTEYESSYSDEFESKNNAKKKKNNISELDGTIAPEYSFLLDGGNDSDNDPEFKPSTSSDEDSFNESTIGEIENCTLKNKCHKGKKISNKPKHLKNILVDLKHVTACSEVENREIQNQKVKVEQITPQCLKKADKKTNSSEISEKHNDSVNLVANDNINDQQNSHEISSQKVVENTHQEEIESGIAGEEIIEGKQQENNNNMKVQEDNEQQTVNEETEATKKKRYRCLESQMENMREKNKVRRHCNCKKKCFEKFSPDERNCINREYWNINKDLQKVWLSSNVTEELSKRKLREGRRDITRKYVLPKINDDGLQITMEVCQNFFLATLGYSNANVLTSLRRFLTDTNGNKRLIPRQDQRGRHTPSNKKDRNIMIADIHTYNPLPSHYSREHAPHRKYLPSDLTIKTMHADYCEKNPDSKVCYEVYRSTIDYLNIGFYEATPEKCGFCQEMDLNDTEENQIRKAEHIEKVTKIREMYRNDQEIATSEARTFAADMQKVVLLPRMPDVKETFFISRLIVYNETFASMQKKEGRHNLVLWHEGIAGRRAEDVASAFIKFLKQNRDDRKIIIWMDNCTGQNKNFIFYSAILCYINSPYCSTEEIHLKYLVKGHTFMAADGLHGRIEQAVRKSKNVYDFNDFKSACFKSSHRSEVTVLEHADFYKFENIIRTRKSNNANDSLPYFKDITSAKFVRGSYDFTYQTSPNGLCITTHNTLKRKAKLEMPVTMTYNRGVSIAKKAKLIKDLLPKMPTNKKQFWIDLPENENSQDLIEEGL